MPIIDIQRSLQEVGRIRTGEQVPTSGGKKRPAKLEQFRLTSRDRTVLDECAVLYGGEVREWEESPGAGSQWELYTTASAIDVVVPPGDLSFTQWYELWNAGGCVRRCTGAEQDYTTGGGPCVCSPDPDKRECKMTTRLSLFMANLPRLALWRLESHGYYAAVELRGAVDLLSQAHALGHMLPASLRLEPRTRKFLDRNGKSQTRNYVVPVLDVRISAMALLGIGSGEVPVTAASVGMPMSALTPVPAALEAVTAPTVAEVVADVDTPPARRSRANPQEPIPPTGRRRRRGPHEGEPPEAPPEPPVEPEPVVDVDPVVVQQEFELGDKPPEPSGEPVDIDAARKDLAARLASLPTVVAAQVKAEWSTLNFPTTLRRPTGWNDQNIAWCQRFVAAAEEKADKLTKEARVRCGIKSRELMLDDDLRHEFVDSVVPGKHGLTECTLDELIIVEAALDAEMEPVA